MRIFMKTFPSRTLKTSAGIALLMLSLSGGNAHAVSNIYSQEPYQSPEMRAAEVEYLTGLVGSAIEKASSAMSGLKKYLVGHGSVASASGRTEANQVAKTGGAVIPSSTTPVEKIDVQLKDSGLADALGTRAD
jgi:hypothetical protein